MKTAIYIEQGVLQVVFTPESDHEKAVLKIAESNDTVKVHRGSFYECRGGWFRHEYKGNYDGHVDDDSLIFVLTPKAK